MSSKIVGIGLVIMRKLLGFLIVVMLSVSLGVGQTKGKPPVREHTQATKFADAEKAWKAFLPKFKEAVVHREFALIRTMMIKDVFCQSKDSNNDFDLRDECLADWRKSSQSNESQVDWKDLVRTLMRKSCYFVKGASGEEFEFSRVVGSSCYNTGGPGATFYFIRGSWYLASFISEDSE